VRCPERIRREGGPGARARSPGRLRFGGVSSFCFHFLFCNCLFLCTFLFLTCQRRGAIRQRRNPRVAAHDPGRWCARV
jgi:hypothetical protein